MRWRGEAYDLSRMQIKTRIVTKKGRKEYCEDREKKHYGGVLLSTFVVLYKSIAVMQSVQSQSIREEGIALSNRMKICMAEAACVHTEIVKVSRLCDSREVRTPLPTQY